MVYADFSSQRSTVIFVPTGVQQTFGYQAMSSQILKIGFSKTQMAYRGLVWPKIFLVKNQSCYFCESLEEFKELSPV